MADRRDITLNVSAKVAEYQKKMAALPGITEKQATKAALKMQNALVKAEGKAAAEAIKASKKAAKSFSDSFAGISLAISLGDIKAAITSVNALSQETADLRNQLSDTATRAGVMAGTIGGLRLAFEGAGIGAAKVESALQTLPKLLDDARAGLGPSALAFERLGISQEMLNTGLKDNDDALKEAIKRLQAVEDPADKAAIAVGALGRSGTFLTQSLGTADLEVFIDQAERFGVGVGPEAAKSAGDFQRSMADLQLVTQGAKASLVDFLDIGPNIDNVVLGFVFMQKAVAGTVGNMSAALGAFNDVIHLRLVPGTQAFQDRLTELGAKTFPEIRQEAAESAKTFLENRNAMRAGEGAAAELSRTLAETSSKHLTTAQATKELAAAQRDADAAERERIKALQTQVTALDALFSAGNKSAEGMLDDREKIAAALDHEIARLNALKATAGDVALAQMAFTRAVTGARQQAALDNIKIDFEQAEEFQKTLDAEVAANEAANQAKAESDAKLRDARREAAQEGLALAETLADTISQIAVDQVDTQQALLDGSQSREEQRVAELMALREGADEATKRGIDSKIAKVEALGKIERLGTRKTLDAQKKAALAAFRASQGVALAQAIVATAAGITRAFSDLGPIAGIPASIAIGAAGTAQSILIAAQKPPQFHQGTGRDGRSGGLAADEQSATVLNKEGVATTRTMGVPGFPELLQALNRQGAQALQQGGRVVQAVVSSRSMSAAMLNEAAGDGALGALLVDRSPGFDPGLT